MITLLFHSILTHSLTHSLITAAPRYASHQRPESAVPPTPHHHCHALSYPEKLTHPLPAHSHTHSHTHTLTHNMLIQSEDIFKYQRLKGKLGSTIKSETVTAACLDENSIVLGTARGHIYVFGLTCKLVKSYQAHKGAVTALAIDPHELTVYRYCARTHVCTRMHTNAHVRAHTHTQTCIRMHASIPSFVTPLSLSILSSLLISALCHFFLPLSLFHCITTLIHTIDSTQLSSTCRSPSLHHVFFPFYRYPFILYYIICTHTSLNYY